MENKNYSKTEDSKKEDASTSVRTYRLKLSLFTSGIARISGIMLQAISLPLAAAALGTQEFSVYAMVAAILSWMTLSNMGLSQAVTLEVASSVNNKREKKEYLARALLVALAIFLIVCGLVSLLMMTNAFDIIFRKNTSEDGYPKREILFVLFVFFSTQVLSIFEGYQLAEQQQYKLNLHMAIGTLISAILVGISTALEPTVLSILVSVHLPVIIARFLNALKIKTGVNMTLSDFTVNRWGDLSPILIRGTKFVSGTTISNFFCHPFTIIVVGATAPIDQSASYAAVINAVLLAVSVLGYVMSPIRGAVPEAYSKGDFGWIRRVYIISICSMILYAAGPAFVLIFFGSSLFNFWYQGMVAPSVILLVGAGVYLMLYCIETVNYNFLVCVGYLEKSSKFVFTKGLLVACVSMPVSMYVGSKYVIWAIVLSTAVVSCVPLLYYARRAILK